MGRSSLTAGLSIGIGGIASVRAKAKELGQLIGRILISIFADALGACGLIAGLSVTRRGTSASWNSRSYLAVGFSIGTVGIAGARANSKQPGLIAGMLVGGILIFIFAEALGGYVLIAGLAVTRRGTSASGRSRA